MPNMPQSLDAFVTWLKKHEALIQPLEKDLGEHNWLLATTGKKEYEKIVAEKRATLRKLYANPAEFKFLSDLRVQELEMDPLLARQLEGLWMAYASHQVPPSLIDQISKIESEVEGIYNNFRGKIDGREVDNNEIRRLLRESKDSKHRQKAWLATKAIGPEVIDKVLSIVRLRNRGAKECGFKNYYLMSLELDELSEKKLFALLDDLEAKSRGAFLAEKKKLDQELAARFGIEVKALQPWHYADPFFQEAPPRDTFNLEPYFKNQDIVELTRKTFTGMGLEIDGILEKSDLFGRPGKDQHAFCTMIGRSRDVRVLCNVERNDYWMSTMLHEFGHGVYDWYLDDRLPYFLHDPAHTLSTEAVAMFFGRLTRHPDWLRQILKLDGQVVTSLVESCRAQERLGMLIFVRWVLVMCHFERALYDNPEQDLNRLWWQLVEKYQDIRTEERRTPDWVCKLHLALAPVYYQNYLLGELIASQVHHFLEAEATDGNSLINNPKVGTFFIQNYFKNGSSLRWDRHLEQATGESLKPDYFLRQYVQRD